MLGDRSLTDTRTTGAGVSRWAGWIVNWQLYVMLLLPVVYVVTFSYVPMYGIIIAFKKFSPFLGFWSSPWFGLGNFERFVTSLEFGRVIRNTLVLNVYSLLVGFPLPLILALSLNAVRHRLYKKTVQMVSYIPYFISIVVVVGMIHQFFNPRIGVFGQLLQAVFGEPINVLLYPQSFLHLMVWSGIWQGIGFGSIIYLSVLSGISPELHEAAMMDGASRLRRIWHIDLPGVLPTAIILLILSLGGMLTTGFEKVLLLQNNINLSMAETIDTYAYKIGLTGVIPDPSYATAIGFFQSLVGFVLIYCANKIARKVGEASLW